MEKGVKFGKFRIIRLLATGGMGELFLARQEGPSGFSKMVALKKVLRHLAADQSFVDLFWNEARLGALLSHHNIAQVYELGEEEGSWYIAMEYVHGRSLRGVMEKLAGLERAVAPVLAARICSQALEGLHYAHGLTDERGRSLGIVHRDISPDNVLISFMGVVKLIDFGIAKAMDPMTGTRTGTVKGKFEYMAPELLKVGSKIDGRTDVYSMGVLLYELLTGTKPFQLSLALVDEVLTQPAPPAIERNPDVPRPLNDIVMRALEKDIEARWESAEAMAVALEGYIASTGLAVTHWNIAQLLRELFGHDAADANPSLTLGTSMFRIADDGPGAVPHLGTRVIASEPHDADASGDQHLYPAEPVTTVGRPGADARTLLAPVPQEPGLDETLLDDEHETSAVLVDPGVLSEAEEDSTAPRGRRSVSRRTRRRIRWGLAAASALALVALAVVLREPQPPPAPARKATPRRVSEGRDGEPPGKTKPLAAAGSESTEEKPSEPPTPVAVAGQGLPEDVARAAERSESASDDGPSGDEGTTQQPEEAIARQAMNTMLGKRFGRVAFKLNPSVEVFHGGRRIGVTPLPPVEFPAGTANFTLRSGTVRKKVSVKVVAGKETVVRADMGRR